MNVGRPVNDTRLEVTVDFDKEDEARVSLVDSCGGDNVLFSNG